MQHMTLREKVRKSAYHYLEPSVGAVANMTLENLKQFIGGTYQPTHEQITLLARRMRLK